MERDSLPRYPRIGPTTQEHPDSTVRQGVILKARQVILKKNKFFFVFLEAGIRRILGAQKGGSNACFLKPTILQTYTFYI